MNEYVGKTCPYCKTVFTEDDEIVVCSVCDMPHHKDCWVENKGCTTFGCLGTIKFPDSSANSTVTQKEMHYDDVPRENGSTSYCVKCGAAIGSGNAFCSRCGNPVSVNGSSQASSTFSNGYQTPVYNQFQQSQQTDLTAFIGDNADIYTRKFSELQINNTKASWNWCAFLLTPYWFIYRKMYDYGAIILGSYFVLSLIGNWILFVASLITSIVFGILGNHIYLQRIQKYSNESMQLSDYERSAYMAKHQGTNIAAAILSAVAYGIIVAVVSALRT